MAPSHADIVAKRILLYITESIFLDNQKIKVVVFSFLGQYVSLYLIFSEYCPFKSSGKVNIKCVLCILKSFRVCGEWAKGIY
jgi:hypothetical protein